MARNLITALLRLTLRVFFRRIEIAGAARVPAESPVLFVVNHPNALVDPIFMLAHAPRRVSFLAKAPLFKMPVVGWLVRAMDSLPVYRKQDEGSDVSQNHKTFDCAREILRAGGAIAICPEGVSHSDTQLKPLKTGAARIALGAVATARRPLDLEIVPAGIYYTSKRSFRSSGLLCFGEPIAVPRIELDERGEPPAEAARELTRRVEKGLRDVTLNAERTQVLETVALAERIFARDEEERDAKRQAHLARELARRREFVARYDLLRKRAPEKLAAMENRLKDFDARLKRIGVRTCDLALADGSIFNSYVARFLMKTTLLALVAPLALVGAIIHYPAYRLVGFLATRFAQQYDDMVSTIKILAAALMFPLTWILLSVALWIAFDWRAALVALIAAPLAGYAALWFLEKCAEAAGEARAFLLRRARREEFARLIAERDAIRREIISFGKEAAA